MSRNSSSIRRMRATMSRVMKRSAESRRCWECGRGAAVSRIETEYGWLRKCRYCGASKLTLFEVTY